MNCVTTKDKTLVSIEMRNGVKCIHYLGYSYYDGEPEHQPYRWVDYIELVCPISEAIKFGPDKWEKENQGFAKKLIEALPKESLIEIAKVKTIHPDEITVDTPCGLYQLATDVYLI